MIRCTISVLADAKRERAFQGALGGLRHGEFVVKTERPAADGPKGVTGETGRRESERLGVEGVTDRRAKFEGGAPRLALQVIVHMLKCLSG